MITKGLLMQCGIGAWKWQRSIGGRLLPSRICCSARMVLASRSRARPILLMVSHGVAGRSKPAEPIRAA